MRIGIDLDGVVYDLMTPWLRRYNERYGDTMQRNDITDFDFEGVEFKCSKEEFIDFLYDGRLHLEALPIPGAVEAIKKFVEAGHTVVFITSTKRPAIWAKLARLAVDLGDIPYELHFTSEKEFVEVDVFIDDRIDACMVYKGTGPVLLFDQPWNRDNKSLCRVISWRNVEIYIERCQFFPWRKGKCGRTS